MSKLPSLVALAFLLAAPAMADTAIPDLRGTWKGDSESVVLGTGSPQHSAAKPGEAEFRSVSFTMNITRQEGRRFVGTFASAKHTETIIGVISRAGPIHIVDDDGIDTATLLAPDRIEMCYQHLAPDSQIVSCTEMVKQP